MAAAIAAIQHNRRPPGQIAAVVEALRPAYDVAIQQPGDLVDNTVRTQVRLTVERLRREGPLAARAADGRLLIVGGRYSLETGLVALIA